MESLDKSKPSSSHSVFLISKFLESLIGKSYKAKKLKTEEVLIEVENKQQSDNLLNQTRMANVDIKITPNRTLNSSQGVISHLDLINETEANLLEGLGDQGVTAVRRITIRRNNVEIPTKHPSLDFLPLNTP